MTEATPSAQGAPRGGTVDGPAPDPTVEALLPVRSTGRNAALVAAAALVLVGAWWSPPLLRPTVTSLGAGSWGIAGPEHDVVGEGLVWRQESPGVTVTGVADVPGAQVAGAWLAEAREAYHAPSPAESPEAFAERLGGVPLPAPLGGGETGLLIVQWEVTDCAALVEGQVPVVTLRGALGTTSTTELDPLFGASFDVGLLKEEGICPEGGGPKPVG